MASERLDLLSRQADAAHPQSFLSPLKRQPAQRELVGWGQMQGHLYDLVEEGAPRLGAACAVPLPERGGDDLVIEREHVARVCEPSRQLHEAEDRLNLPTVESVDVVDEDDDTPLALFKDRLETLPQLFELDGRERLAKSLGRRAGAQLYDTGETHRGEREQAAVAIEEPSQLLLLRGQRFPQGLGQDRKST